MQLKWIGSVLVILGCGGWGFSLAAAYVRQERQLKMLSRLLGLLRRELKYRLTPLPELARLAAKECTGSLKNVFLDFARELDWNSSPDAYGCMAEALKRHDCLPPKVRRLLRQLGRTLGRYDLEGQLQGMDAVEEECRHQLESLGADKEIRLRSYRTLGLCAGFALVILFV